MKPYQKTARAFTIFLGSRTFFVVTVLLFVVQASWIALSARYPQAFDEQFHLGLIRLYSQHLSPFLNQQPAGADVYGAMFRDPSYLYHYLFSFPYRLLAHFTHDETIQVIFLRLMNVGLLGSSLLVFRKILRFTSASQPLINVSLFFLVLTPVFPLLGSQINYDNMLVLLSGLAILWCLRLVTRLRAERQWSWDILAQLLIICLLSSLVKYAFLPIFIAIACVVLFYMRKERALIFKNIRPLRQLVHLKSTLYVLVLLGFTLLFSQRYMVNLALYRTPLPECDQVLSMQRCQSYAPWSRNYSFEQLHQVHLGLGNVATYPFVWLYHCMGELVFTISSGFNNVGAVDYFVGTQLIIIEVLSWGIFGIGLLLCLRYGKVLWRQENLRIFLLIIVLYVGALGAQNLLDYLHVGDPVAIHGRYLLPILPLVYIIVGLAFREALNSKKTVLQLSAAGRKVTITGVAMFVLLFEGGGFVTYIVRSDPSWFWPQSPSVQKANSKAQKILRPIIVDKHKK